MSKAKICDRCRTDLKCSPSATIQIDFGYYGIMKYSLCEECKRDLIIFMRGSRNEHK